MFFWFSFCLFHFGRGPCIQTDPILINSDVAWDREEEIRNTEKHFKSSQKINILTTEEMKNKMTDKCCIGRQTDRQLD